VFTRASDAVVTLVYHMFIRMALNSEKIISETDDSCLSDQTSLGDTGR